MGPTMFGWLRTYRAGRRLRREWKECAAALDECDKRNIGRHEHSRRRSSASVKHAPASGTSQSLSDTAMTDNEADVEYGDDDEEIVSSDITEDSGNKLNASQHGSRLSSEFANKLRLFFSDLRSACESLSGENAVDQTSPVSEPHTISSFDVEPGTLDRAYGSDLNEVIVLLLRACMIGSNAEHLSTSRRSLAKRASMIAPVPDGTNLDSILVYECLVFLEIILREQKYQTFLTSSSGEYLALANLLRILEAVYDIQSKKLALHILYHAAEMPSNRMWVVRAKGPKRILRLLLIKDENLFYHVMQTLRLFLESGAGEQIGTTLSKLSAKQNAGAAHEDRSSPQAEMLQQNMTRHKKSASGLSEASSIDESLDGDDDGPSISNIASTVFRELGKLMPWVEETGNSELARITLGGDELASTRGLKDVSHIGTRGDNSKPTEMTSSGKTSISHNSNGVITSGGSSNSQALHSSLEGKRDSKHRSKNSMERPSPNDFAELQEKAKRDVGACNFENRKYSDAFTLPSTPPSSTAESFTSSSLEHRAAILGLVGSPTNSESGSLSGRLSMLEIPALGMSPDGVNKHEAGSMYSDFMRRQGVVSVLTQMLRQELHENPARPEQMLEVLGALQILLNSTEARSEFLRLGGYQILERIPLKLASADPHERRRRGKSGRSEFASKSVSSIGSTTSTTSIASDEYTKSTAEYAEQRSAYGNENLCSSDASSVEDDLFGFYTQMLHLITGNYTPVEMHETAESSLKNSPHSNKDSVLDVNALEVVVKTLTKLPEDVPFRVSIMRHSIICLLDMIIIHPLHVTYLKCMGVLDFLAGIVSGSVESLRFMAYCSDLLDEWNAIMTASDNILRIAATTTVHFETSILLKYVGGLKMLITAIRDGPLVSDSDDMDLMQHANNPADTFSKKPVAFAELCMQHLGRLLTTISSLIGDAHSISITLNLGVTGLFLDLLDDQLRLLRRWPSLLKWVESHRMNSRDSDEIMSDEVFSMDIDPMFDDDLSESHRQTYQLKPSKMTAIALNDNVMKTLEIIGMMTLCDGEREFIIFDKRQGWSLLLNCIRSGNHLSQLRRGLNELNPIRGRKITVSTPQEPVSELALWLLREMALAGAAKDTKNRGGGGIRWMLRLLREAWPKVTFNLLESASSINLEDGHSSGYYSQSSDDDETGIAMPGSSLRLALLRSIAVLFTKEPAETLLNASQHGLPMMTIDISGSSRGQYSSLHSQQNVANFAEGHDSINGSYTLRVPVGHSGTNKILQSMKVAFGDSGGLVQLVDIVCRKPRRQYANSKTREMHVAESREAFLALGEVVRMCERNKRHIASHYGFISLSTKLKESMLEFDDRIYGTLLEIALDENSIVPPLFHGDNIRDDVCVALSLSLLPRVVHILKPKSLWPIIDKCSRPGLAHLDLNQHDPQSSPSEANTATESDHSSNLPATMGAFNPAPERDISKLRQASSVESEITTSRGLMSSVPRPDFTGDDDQLVFRTKSIDSLEKMSHQDAIQALTMRFAEFEAAMTKQTLSSPRSARSRSQPWEKSLSTLAIQTPMINYVNCKFRSTESAVMLIMLLPDSPITTQGRLLHALHLLIEANPCNARALCDMQVSTFLLRIAPKLHEQVLDLYMHLVSKLLAYDVDHDVTLLLFRLAQSNPLWLRTMIDKDLELDASNKDSPFIDDSSIGSDGQTGSLSLKKLRQANESRVYEFESRRRNLKSLIINLLGSNIERMSPLSYFHFSKSGGALRTSSLEKFPVAKVGYSCSMWISITSFSCPEPTILSWGSSNSSQIYFQLFFMKTPRLNVNISAKKGLGSGTDNTTPYYYLCIRSWPSLKIASESGSGEAFESKLSTSNKNEESNSTRHHQKAMSRVPVKCFNGYKWTQSRRWHHIVFSHVKNDVSIFVDGVAIESTWIVPAQLHHESNHIQQLIYYPGVKGTASNKTMPSKENTIYGCIAKRADEIFKLNGTSIEPSRSQFCGMISSIRLSEGSLDGQHARAIYSQGCTFLGAFSDIGVPGKLFMTIDASSYSDIGRARGNRTQSSLSAHFRSRLKSVSEYDPTNKQYHSKMDRSNSAFGSFLAESFLSRSIDRTDSLSNISPRRRVKSITEVSSVPRRKGATFVKSFEKQSFFSRSIQDENSIISTSASSKRPSVSLLTRSPERRSLGGVPRNSSGSMSDPRTTLNRRRNSSSSGDMDDSILNGRNPRLQSVSELRMSGLDLDTSREADRKLYNAKEMSSMQNRATEDPFQLKFRGQNQNVVEIEGAVEIHNTSSMQDIVRDMDGLMLACKFLELGEKEQMSGLRILCLLLKRCPKNILHLARLQYPINEVEFSGKSTADVAGSMQGRGSHSETEVSGSSISTNKSTKKIDQSASTVENEIQSQHERTFTHIFGFDVIHFLLRTHRDWWTADMFDYLFDMATDHAKSVEYRVSASADVGRPHDQTRVQNNTRGGYSVLSQQYETVNILLSCLLSLDIRSNVETVRNILGGFVDFLGECPFNLNIFRCHTYGFVEKKNTKLKNSDEQHDTFQADSKESKGHLNGCGIKFLIDLMVEILGNAMLADNLSASSKGFSQNNTIAMNSKDSPSNFQNVAFDLPFDELSSSSSGTVSSMRANGRSMYEKERSEVRAVFAERQAAFFPVIGVIRSILLKCTVSSLSNLDQVAFDGGRLTLSSQVSPLPTTKDELCVLFDFLICDSKKLPHKAAQIASDIIKVQIADLLLNLIGTMQNDTTIQLLDALRTIPDSEWDVPFSLMKSSIPRLRIVGLKMLKVFLRPVAAQKSFRKIQGFNILLQMSVSWNASASLLAALMSLATSQSIQEPQISHTSDNSIQRLVFPEVLEILLSVLKRCSYENRHVSAQILCQIEDLFSAEKQQTESGQQQVYNNIVALLDHKNYAVHWIYWFYELIRFREERFMGASQRWSVGEDEDGEDLEEEGSSDAHDHHSKMAAALRRQPSDDSQGDEISKTSIGTNDTYFDDDTSDSSPGSSSPALNSVYQAEEARYRLKSLRSQNSNAASLAMSPRSTAGSAPSLSGMSAMSLDSTATSGMDAGGAFGVYTSIYRMIRRLLVHDMCRSWRKNSSRLFNEMMHMAGLVDGITFSTFCEAEGSAGGPTLAQESENTGASVVVASMRPSGAEIGAASSQNVPSIASATAKSEKVPDKLESDEANRKFIRASPDHVFHPISFVAYVIEDLMENIKKAPKLPFARSFLAFASSSANSTIATTNTLKNLMALLDKIPQRIAISEAIMQKNCTLDNGDGAESSGYIERYANTPELMAHAVGAVSAMATQNEGDRSRMRDTGLLQLLEQLLMKCLSPFVLCTWEWEQRINSIISMRPVFERATSSKAFITGNGILFLVQLFVDMTTISNFEDIVQHDPQLWYWQVQLSTLMASVFRKSNSCRKELVKLIEDPDIMDAMLPAVGMETFDHRATLVALGSWWSSSSYAGGNGGGKDDTVSVSSSPTTSSLASSPKSESEDAASKLVNRIGQNRNVDPDKHVHLLAWLAWINDKNNVDKKETLRKRIALLLGPVYKTTDTFTKKSIKTTTRSVQKHREACEKTIAKQTSKVLEQELRWQSAVAASTERTALWQSRARDTRLQGLSRGESGWGIIKSLDGFYDDDFYKLVTEEYGRVDPWDAICEFVLRED